MVQIIKSVKLNDHPYIDKNDLASCRLPEGFLFLLTDKMELIEPVLLYLYDKCVQNANIKSVGNTQQALANDLYEWFSFLEEELKKTWDLVINDDFFHYLNTYTDAISPHTKRKYKTSTIRRRLTTITDFYKFAIKQKWIDNVFDFSKLIPNDKELKDPDAFEEKDLKTAFHQLGAAIPLDLSPPKDTHSVRDRLIAEIKFVTGMRIDEVLGLNTPLILGIDTDEDVRKIIFVVLTKTKGRKTRKVGIPIYVIQRIQWYIRYERELVIQKARKIKKIGKRSIPNAIFLNGLDSNNRDIACPLTPKTYDRIFHNAMMTAGITRKVEVYDSYTGTMIYKDVPKHTPHDLRHTFADIQYKIRKAEGDNDPSFSIQRDLGHTDVNTTRRLYLGSAGMREGKVGDAYIAYLRSFNDE